MVFSGSSDALHPSRYLFSEEKGNWYNARQYCYDRGYHLAEIESAEEQLFLNYLTPHTGQKSWNDNRCYM